MRPDYTLTDRDFINPDTIDLYGNTNAHLLTAPPAAFVLEFPGLGGGSCLGGCMDVGPYNGPLSGFLAERGILQVYTFPGPWSWMNRGAVRMIHALVDAIREKYGFTRETPWAVMVADYEMPITEALKTLSPVHRVEDMPHIPYHIINDLADELFPPEQMDAYVEALRGKGHTVTYHRLPNCRHGELTGEEWEVIRTFLLGHLVK